MLKQLDSLKDAFRVGYSQVDWHFENSLLYQSQRLVELSPGVIWQPGEGANDEQVIVSDQEFTKGVHGFRVRFDEVSENFRCHVLLGLLQMRSKKQTAGMTMMTTNNSNGGGSMQLQ